MKKILMILAVVAMFGLVGCEMSTPPIATPNLDPPDANAQSFVNLPLYSAPLAYGGGSDSDGDEAGVYSEPKPIISADPSTIYISGSSIGTNSSLITVDAGVFVPNSEVEVWGVVGDADAVESPPLIVGADQDKTKEKVQLTADGSGGLTFELRAGTTPGIFNIYVSGLSQKGVKTDSVAITILE